MKRTCWWCLVMLVSPTAWGQSGAAHTDEVGAVVLVSDCTTSGEAAITRAFRSALARAGIATLSEADTAAPFGGLSVRTPAELRQSLTDARDAFINGQVELARQSLQALSEQVALLAPSADRWELQRAVLTNLAQVQGRSDKAAARATLTRILSVEPDYRPDPIIFPPSFLAQVRALRDELSRAPSGELRVTTDPAGIGVVVGGRPVGGAPAALRLPSGGYPIEGNWGYRGLTLSVELTAAPVHPIEVLLTRAKEGSIAPDGGPCALPLPRREGALARVAAVLGVRRIYALRTERSPGAERLVAEEFDAAAGHAVREVSEQVAPPDSGSQAAVRLAQSLGLQSRTGTTGPTGAVVNSGLRTWSYVAGAVGLAATAVGLGLYFSGNSQLQKLYSQYAAGNNAFPPGYESTFQSQDASAKTSKTVGAVLTGVGVVTLATGVALFFVSASGGRSDTMVTVGPYAQPSGGGAIIAGRF